MNVVQLKAFKMYGIQENIYFKAVTKWLIL